MSVSPVAPAPAAAPAASAPDAPAAPAKDAPEAPKPPEAPKKKPGKPDIFLRMTWDDGIFKREHQVGMNFNWINDEAFKLDKAWSDKRGPGGRTELDPSDHLQRVLALVTMGRVMDQKEGIDKLQSNFKAQQAPPVKGGLFKFEYKGPGAEKALRYFGSMQAMPEPLAQVLDAMKEMKEHF